MPVETETGTAVCAGPTLSSLIDVHDNLEQLFFEHQSALLAGDYDLALDRIVAYDATLAAHITFENEVLMPVYSRVEHAPGGAVTLFVSEHAKLRRYVNGIRKGLEEVRAGAPEPARRVIEIFDFEYTFKNLMAHHDQRERNLFYPTLERVTDDEEKTRLLAAAPK